MFTSAEPIYADFHKGKFFYSREKKKEDDDRKNGENGKIQVPDARYLHNLFITAIVLQSEDEICIRNVNISKYRLFVDRYSLRGITIETEKLAPSHTNTMSGSTRRPCWGNWAGSAVPGRPFLRSLKPGCAGFKDRLFLL